MSRQYDVASGSDIITLSHAGTKIDKPLVVYILVFSNAVYHMALRLRVK